MVRLGGRFRDAYGRPRRAARAVALLAAALALGGGGSGDGAPLARVAASAGRPAAPAPYWPTAWLDGTPTRPHGIPYIAPLGAATDEVAIAPPPVVFDAPAGPPVPPPAVLSTAVASTGPTGGVWSVVIGIDDYPGSRADLRSAAADARDVDAALDRYGVPPDQRLLLLDRQADAATIARALDWLVARAGPEATAVVFYAGHVRELSRTTEAIVAADGGLVTDADVAAHLAPLRAARTWLAFASCYGGGFDEALAPGRILTAAAGGDALAYESGTYGRSYLVEYMVRRAMLQGRADASVEAAFAWAAAELARDHPRRVPVQFDHADGDVRLGPGGAPPGQAPPAPPPAAPPPDKRPSSPPTTEPERGCGFTVGSLVRCPDR